MSDEAPSISDQQRLFIEHYLACLNGAEAARRAGYGEAGARQQAHRLLTNVNIRAEIDRRLNELTMPKGEILHRLTAIARADIGDYFTPSGKGVRLDFARAKRDGITGVVKKYSRSPEGAVTLELYDQHAALIKLGEVHGIFRDRIADGLDAIAAAARSLDQKLMADLEPGAPGGADEPPDGAGEGGTAP